MIYHLRGVAVSNYAITAQTVWLVVMNPEFGYFVLSVTTRLTKMDMLFQFISTEVVEGIQVYGELWLIFGGWMFTPQMLLLNT